MEKIRTNQLIRIAVAALLSSTALSFVRRAHADDKSDSDHSSESPVLLGNVVVTAEKHVATVQSTPISMAVNLGEDLQARGISDFALLAQATPGVSLKSEGPGQTEIEMRGMTSSGGNAPTVGFYFDDIALTAPAGAQNGKVVLSPPLYDMNRIEVLRGPQGTLYGSGSMGGTVKLITNQPDLSGFHGSAQSILSGTEGGGFNHNDNLMLNIPLVQDKLALRLVGTEAHMSGWIDRIVANPFPLVSDDGSTRGDVKAAPIQTRYRNSNADQFYSLRATLLWKASERLSITSSFLYLDEKQNGISAFDSVPGNLAHYQPFDIAEPKSDKETVGSINVNYSFDSFDATLIASYWSRRSIQVEESSEDFNNPNTGTTYASNYGLPNPGYYGPSGSGVVYGREDDPTNQYSGELRFTSKDKSALTWVAGAYFSHYWATWNFKGTSLNPSAYMDLGTFAPATTTDWFDAVSPTTINQYALFGNATYALTSRLKANVGLRLDHYDYKFSSVITGWGSALGAATPSDSGLITQSETVIDPKFNLSYSFDQDLTTYATVAKGFRPGGGNAQYPVTGPYWSAVFAPYNFTGNKWPSSYKSDSVWSYEIGAKSRWLGRRLMVNASLYFEDWNHIQLLALPGDWALNINGNHAKIYGGDIEARAILGRGRTGKSRRPMCSRMSRH